MTSGGIMDMRRRAESVHFDLDIIARTAAARSARNRVLREGCVKVFGSLLSALRASGMRRELFALSDRQLTDAGIDLTRAGRGKAAAARPDPNLEGSR